MAGRRGGEKDPGGGSSSDGARGGASSRQAAARVQGTVGGGGLECGQRSSGAAAVRPWAADARRRRPDGAGEGSGGAGTDLGPLGPDWVPRARSMQDSQSGVA
jgi:hypothetical protein